MAGGVVLRIRLRFHDHAPKQAAIVLAFHQPAAHQFRSHHLCRAGEKGFGEDWEILRDGLVFQRNDLTKAKTVFETLQ